MTNVELQPIVTQLKALSDIHRLHIVEMLSCGELCACEILEKFAFTQPTLSHHMRILCACGLVSCRKEGKWAYYSLHEPQISALLSTLNALTSDTERCICKEGNHCD